MSLPPLEGFMASAPSLHRAVRVLGALRKFARAPEPNHLELGLRIEPSALSTEALPGGASVRLDFKTARIVITRGSTHVDIGLNGFTTRSLLEAVLDALDSVGAGLVQGAASRVDAFLEALRAKGLQANFGAGHEPDDEALEVSLISSAAFGAALDRAFEGLSRFRSRLNGAMTPLVVWPHHFDASMLWFQGAVMAESEPHLNFGFAAFDDEFHLPYLYAYASPMPEGFDALEPPAPWHWHTNGWQGAVIGYEALRSLESVEHAFSAISAVLTTRDAPRR
jgi:hypothetical protein